MSYFVENTYPDVGAARRAVREDSSIPLVAQAHLDVLLAALGEKPNSVVFVRAAGHIPAGAADQHGNADHRVELRDATPAEKEPEATGFAAADRRPDEAGR